MDWTRDHLQVSLNRGKEQVDTLLNQSEQVESSLEHSRETEGVRRRKLQTFDWSNSVYSMPAGGFRRVHVAKRNRLTGRRRHWGGYRMI